MHASTDKTTRRALACVLALIALLVGGAPTANASTTPTVTGVVAVKAGSVNETPENNGISHFVEHMIFKTTAKYGPGNSPTQSLTMKTTATNESPSPTPPLTGSHLRTYQAIFQHPISRNLGWHDAQRVKKYEGSGLDMLCGRLRHIGARGYA